MAQRSVHAIATLAALTALAGGCSDATGADVVMVARVAEIEVPERVPAGAPLTVRFSYDLACGSLDRLDVRHGAGSTTITVVARMPAGGVACPDIYRYEPVALTLPPVTTTPHVVRFRQPGGDDDSFLTVVGGD